MHGLRPGGFSVSMNSREVGGDVVTNMWNFMLHGKNAWTPTILARHVLTTHDDYPSALAQFSNARLVNPCYFVIAAGDRTDGAVISSARENALDVWKLGQNADNHVTSRNNVQSDFFRLQTNYDHWQEVPSWDNRRQPGLNNMNALGGPEHVNFDTLYNVITAPPTKNMYTVTTSIMCPTSGNITTWVGEIQKVKNDKTFYFSYKIKNIEQIN